MNLVELLQDAITHCALATRRGNLRQIRPDPVIPQTACKLSSLAASPPGLALGNRRWEGEASTLFLLGFCGKSKKMNQEEDSFRAHLRFSICLAELSRAVESRVVAAASQRVACVTEKID